MTASQPSRSSSLRDDDLLVIGPGADLDLAARPARSTPRVTVRHGWCRYRIRGVVAADRDVDRGRVSPPPPGRRGGRGTTRPTASAGMPTPSRTSAFRVV